LRIEHTKEIMDRRKFSFGALAALFTAAPLIAATSKAKAENVKSDTEIRNTTIHQNETEVISVISGKQGKSKIVMDDDGMTIQYGENKILIDEDGVKFQVNGKNILFTAPQGELNTSGGESGKVYINWDDKAKISVYDPDFINKK
jgi:hypothetical protein